MKTTLKNPVELFILINILSIFTPPSIIRKHHFKRIISSRIGENFKEQQELAEKKLEFVDDIEKLKLAKESLKKLQEENVETRKEILLIMQDFIFVDDKIAPAERKLYQLATKYLQLEHYPISPSIELFEYMHVLSYVSKSEFASIHNFIQIWKKYMGPDVIYFYLEAQKNLENLSLEDQLIKIEENLKNMRELSFKEKTNIKLMVDEIIWIDEKLTKQEKIVYDLLLENLEIESDLQENIEKHSIRKIFSQIVLNPFFTSFINISIIITSITVGFETDYKIAKDFAFEFYVINTVIRFIFLAEILMRFIAEWNRPKDFFSNRWNLFDLSLVVGSFLPLGNFPLILRILRLARFAKILQKERHLRIIIQSFLHSIKPTAFVCLLLLIIIYIYAVIGTTLFSENDPIHFGRLTLSMQTLIQITFEGWTDILYIQMYGCRNFGYADFGHLCNFPTSMPVTALIYFLSFIVLNGLVIINLVVGIIIDNWNVTKEKMEKEDELDFTVKHIDIVVGKIRAKRFENIIDEKEE